MRGSEFRFLKGSSKAKSYVNEITFLDQLKVASIFGQKFDLFQGIMRFLVTILLSKLLSDAAVPC